MRLARSYEDSRRAPRWNRERIASESREAAMGAGQVCLWILSLPLPAMEEALGRAKVEAIKERASRATGHHY